METAVLIVLLVAFVLLLFLALICAYIFNQLVWRKTIPVPAFILKHIAGNDAQPDAYEKDAEQALEQLRALPLEHLELTAPDGARLCAYLLVPEHSNGKLLLACHGARSSSLGEFRFMAPALYKQGYTILMPDHRGCGESDGKYMGYGTHESKDTFLWVRYAKARFPALSIFLLGVSMGGATVLMMSNHADDPAIRGIIADCPYTSAWAEFSYQVHTSFHLPDFPLLHICNLWCRLCAGYDFREASPLEAVRAAKKPILFIHGGADDYVPVFMQAQLFEACPGEKTCLTVDGAVHARSYYTNPAAYEAALQQFTEQCLKGTQA